MDIFSKNKFLIRLVWVLIVINLACIGFLWWQVKSDHKRIPEKKNIEKITSDLKQKLELSDNQFQQFKNIRKDFFEKEEKLSLMIKAQRDSMNAEMFSQNTDTVLVKDLARRVSENEYRMEMYRFEQAKQLQHICSKEQLQKFHNLVIEIRDYLKPEKPGNRPVK
jgi:hypothetical protein